MVMFTNLDKETIKRELDYLTEKFNPHMDVVEVIVRVDGRLQHTTYTTSYDVAEIYGLEFIEDFKKLISKIEGYLIKSLNELRYM